MTAYIDNIIIQGTPEEIQEFMELRKPDYLKTFPNMPNETYPPHTFWGGYQHTEDQRTNPDGSITISADDLHSGISVSEGNLTDTCKINTQ